jgi:tetratricopeptide (TPR) repeat protein
MTKLLNSLVMVLALSLGASNARAGDSPARVLFQEANAHFAVGEFSEAAEKYMEAYKIKQDAALLYNAAQSFRLAGNNAKALVLYKNFLQFYPKAPNVEEVRGQILKLNEAIAAAEKAKTAPPTSTAEHVQPLPPETKPATPETPPTTPPPSTTTTTEPPPTTTTSTTQASTSTSTSTSEHKTPIYKKWWLWTIVGVVVVGGAVTGAVLATSSSGGKWTTTNDFGPGAAAILKVSF